MYKLFLTLRYLRKRRIAYFAIAAVTLCVAMVLIVMSVMGGFLENVRSRARGLLGDIIVDNRDVNGFPLYPEFIAEIEQWPEIAEATPVIYTYGIMRFPSLGQVETIRVVGLNLQETFRVNAFEESLYYNELYPNTTTLEPQQQPLVGVELTSQRTAEVLLPEPYASALAESQAAGIVDEDAEPPLTPEQRAESSIEILNDPPGRWATRPVEAPLTPPGYEGDPWPGLIVGTDLVARRESDGRYVRRYPKGELATVTMLRVSHTGNVETPQKQPFRYVDDSRTGIYEIDSQHVYCDFSLLQRLLEMDAGPEGNFPPRCSQIQIKVDPDVVRTAQQREALTARMVTLYKELGVQHADRLDSFERSLVSYVEAMTWEQSQIHIIAPVEKERILVTILFGIISLVAAVLVLCILYMIVLQKTRDIGIIKAIGGSSTGLSVVFVFYGLAIGVVGSALGGTLGYLFVTNINEFQAFLISLNPAWQVWDRSVYSFDEIPNRVDPTEMTALLVASVVFSMLGSTLAAWRAGVMHPVEALRHE